MMKWFSRIMGKRQFKIQTFTYYIPAPPPRKTGYREKEFDSFFYQFINLGFEVLQVQTVPHTGANQCGMWVMFLVRALNAEAEKLDLEFEGPISEAPPYIEHTETAGSFEREIELPSYEDERAP